MMTDEEKAARIREQIKGPLEVLCNILTEARKEKIEVGFNIATDPTGRSFVQILKLTKEL